jgi:hypothetical protein
MNHTELVEKYKTQSMHYFENALSSIEAGDAEKAGEFVWGSMADAIKAVAAKKGVRLWRHQDIEDYAKSLAKELGDEEITKAHGLASALHSNFYEAGLRIEDVRLRLDQIKDTIGKLLDLAGEEKRNKEGRSPS